MNPQALGIIDMTFESDDEVSNESDEIIDEEFEKELKGIVKEDMDDRRSDGMSARDGFNETFNDMDTREDDTKITRGMYEVLEDVFKWFEEEGGDENELIDCYMQAKLQGDLSLSPEMKKMRWRGKEEDEVEGDGKKDNCKKMQKITHHKQKNGISSLR